MRDTVNGWPLAMVVVPFHGLCVVAWHGAMLRHRMQLFVAQGGDADEDDDDDDDDDDDGGGEAVRTGWVVSMQRVRGTETS